ncbi:hypothetical protein [Bacillus cereus]|uniref:hypothetical protein n=1 Tax=Bacillus TaxID=1386 RepID=UPI001298E4F2|nr:hypothetical protein [Bacillus cereus]MEB8691157.1 hypothetical protein [Bacillus cereus]MED1637835.1 hypothetical protein [Bacillus thuringiensis]MRB34448.1 hypothetical protein [Bacillus thuringiensis]
MNMVGFADEETYKRVVKALGFIPDNLKMNSHMPKGKVVLVDIDALSELPRLRGREVYPIL